MEFLAIIFENILTLDETQRRQNRPYKYILLSISVFSRNAYDVPLLSKRGDEVTRAPESIFEQYSFEKI